MTQEIKHTPLPWQLDQYDDENIIYVEGDEGDSFPSCYQEIAKNDDWEDGENRANAEFIVRACNNHYDLIEALEEALMNRLAKEIPLSLAMAIVKKDFPLPENIAVSDWVKRSLELLKKAKGE